ncbi:hypothetical protein KN10_1138 [Anoxybacillus flavithermus NBRC 109594]|uniref:Uncharacterized protein n=2 Tax=Anoxybacillus flavithermus TaxID=33934 RepID=A0A178TH16_9BACL|nr:hypothetical protein A0O32_1568 [Anoxybacillus flavithermus]OAO80663.1 hypothetical protein TAF16_1026 [Anoxybacillus flavithermus]GAC90702.1 hypothetical protein KN10_1138 [Anoxybacillus flavithermus NBRC 109594]
MYFYHTGKVNKGQMKYLSFICIRLCSSASLLSSFPLF